jgi:PAS domain S-box-containing protein
VSGDRWRSLLDAVDQGVCLLDAGGRVSLANQAFEKLVGCVPGEKLPPWVQPSNEVRRSSCWLSIARHGDIVVVTDITERWRTEEALRASGEALHAIIDSSPLAILALDLDMNVTMWSSAAEHMFGWKPEEVLGRPYRLVPEAEREQFRAFFERVIGGGGFTGVEARRVRKDGTSVIVSLSTAPLRDASGSVIGAMALLGDLTEKKQLEEQSRQGQRMEAVGRLAGGIAHDFNNLLTIITNTCEFLLAGLENEKKQEEVRVIQKSAQRAGDLTRQLLAFSRRQVLQPKELDLNAVVRNVTGLLERLIGEDIVVVLDLDEGLGRVSADPGQLEQVIVNLAVNARDAMPRGGTLTIGTAVAAPEGTHARLSVTDTGVGMDEDTLRHVFEPFFTTKAQGTGLGLSTVYGIARQSGGDIDVVSAPGKGTTFNVYIPLAAGAYVSEPRVMSRPERRGSERVLVIEDDEPLRRIVTRVLETLGYSVIEAENGEKALSLLAEHELSVDVLLTDVVMPGMNGREVAERFVQARPETKVLFMSGYTDDEVLRRGVSGAGAPFLQKPFTPDELATKLREVMGDDPI